MSNLQADAVAVQISSGAGLTPAGKFIPIIRVVFIAPAVEGQETPPPLTLHYTPEKARKIGLDLLSSAVMSWSDAAIRTYAKEYGIDGDTILSFIKTVVEQAEVVERG